MTFVMKTSFMNAKTKSICSGLLETIKRSFTNNIAWSKQIICDLKGLYIRLIGALEVIIAVSMYHLQLEHQTLHP